ncbi:PilT/PilU family type 4a pilus ATPase [bacterium]|nr:PilT/PilU family type 4a pilus ATPase [bacterium]MBU1994216.1 PilT/PilU family type 4a pilus ATPase [bacterium]
MDKEVDVSQLSFEQLKKVRAHLKKLIEVGGSDLHLKANAVIRARINGNIVQFAGGVFSKDDALIFSKELLRGRYAEFVEQKELDMVYAFDEKNRFRVNIFFQMDGVSAVFRVIPIKIPTMEDLYFPEVMNTFTQKERGLVLVTGVTGSGKSTTLAALINQINLTKKKHIITIEDPIEFVHKDRGCIINQRSVGQDTLSFTRALRAALREDPDIILVGEMRDRETINLALHAADTGHLVFSTLHTVDAKETINRIIATFPIEEQNRVRNSLAGVIQGIISQRLIQTVDGGRRAAMEILVRTPTIEKLIMENRDYEIKDAIEKGREYYKSQSFDQAIFDLYNEGIISKDKAKDNATSASDLELKMSGLNTGQASEHKEPLEAKKIETKESNDIFDLK